MSLKLKIRPNDIIEYIFLFVVFVSGQSVWFRFIENNRFIKIAIVAIILAVILIILNKSISKNIVFKMAIILAYLMVYLLFNYDVSKVQQYLVKICLSFCVFYILADQLWHKGRLKKFVLKFSDIVCLFALISFVLYILGTCLHVLPESVDTYEWATVTKNTVNYFHLMYEAQTEEVFGITVIRNCGIFAEAPSYAVPLLLSLFLELFIRGEIKKTRIIILAAAMITSYSTKSISIALIIIALKLCEYAYSSGKNKKIKGLKNLLRAILPIILLVFVALALQLVNIKVDTSSGFVRIDNILAGWKAFLTNPLFGVGYENETALNRFATYETVSGGFAMGLPVLLGEGGIYLFIFYIFGMIRFVKCSSDKFVAASFIITHLMILMTSNIPYFLSTVLILAIEYSAPSKTTVNVHRSKTDSGS